MCTLYDKTRKRAGYKVLAYKDSKFYSTFTGQEIKIGKVNKAPILCKRLSEHWNQRLENNELIELSFYNSKFNGNTSAFIDIIDAVNLARKINNYSITNHKIIIAKILFITTVFNGRYEGVDIIAGNKIKSIKLLKIL